WVWSAMSFQAFTKSSSWPGFTSQIPNVYTDTSTTSIGVQSGYLIIFPQRIGRKNPHVRH
ncbi:MAG TPA: hypothetical protein VJS86_07420, partial [Arthrobacter sp.]|nr:hypothetical protein [Arthrobacter sp.]